MKTGTILLLFFYFLLLMMAGIACRAPQKTKMATVIEQLMEGNHRFASMHQSHPHDTKQRRVEISEAQHPFAALYQQQGAAPERYRISTKLIRTYCQHFLPSLRNHPPLSSGKVIPSSAGPLILFAPPYSGHESLG